MKEKKPSTTHTHISPDGTQVTHADHNHDDTDVQGHEHGHTHGHESTKLVLNRLSRASGHLDAVRRMVEEGKDCTEVLTQLSAVIAALNNTGKVILKDHLSHCIVDAAKSGNQKAIDDLNTVIGRFIR